MTVAEAPVTVLAPTAEQGGRAVALRFALLLAAPFTGGQLVEAATAWVAMIAEILPGPGPLGPGSPAAELRRVLVQTASLAFSSLQTTTTSLRLLGWAAFVALVVAVLRSPAAARRVSGAMG